MVALTARVSGADHRFSWSAFLGRRQTTIARPTGSAGHFLVDAPSSFPSFFELPLALLQKLAGSFAHFGAHVFGCPRNPSKLSSDLRTQVFVEHQIAASDSQADAGQNGQSEG